MKPTTLIGSIAMLFCALIFTQSELNAQASTAQLVTLGTGTTANSSFGYPAPYGNYYWGARHQILIKRSELPSFCIDSITTLAFDISSVNNCPALNGYTIKMGHTSLDAMTEWVDGLTTVYSTTSYTPTTGWNTHTFQTPFLYNNCDNIVVEVCFNNTSWVSGGNASHRYTGTSYSSVRYYRADANGVCGNNALTGTSFNRPNIRLNTSGITGTVDVCMEALTQPGGQCSYGASETVAVAFKNNGSSTLTSIPFSYQANGGTLVNQTWTGSLAAGASDTLVFSTTANLSSGSPHNFLLYNSLSTDFCDQNDTIRDTLTAQLNGIYNIGGTSPDYSTIQAAFDDLVTTGICGPVTLHIRDGIYTGLLSFDAVPGASSTNTIRVMSDPSNSALAELSNSSVQVIALNGTKHVTFDSLEFTMTGTTGYIANMSGVNENLAFEDCIFNGSTSTSTTTLNSIIYQPYGASDYYRGLRIENCHFENGSYSINTRGYFTTASKNQNLKVLDCEFEGFMYAGIFDQYTDTLLLEGNSLESATYTWFQYSIYTTSANQATITNNSALTQTTNYGHGLYYTGGGTIASRSLISNNMISVPNCSGNSRGVYVSGSYIDVVYNSIRASGTSTSTAYASLYCTSSLNSVKNNAVYRSGSGYAFYGSTVAAQHSHNVFYTEAGTLTNVTLNTNEFNSDPGFNSATDLYISSLTNTYDNGTPLTYETDDIDSNSRDATTPDIGASEYDLPDYDAGVSDLNSPVSPILVGSNGVSVEVTNYGIEAIDTVTVDWELNGSAQTSTQFVGNINAGASQANISLGSAVFPSGFSTIKAWTEDPDNETDENNPNDTMEFTVCTALSGTYTLGSGALDDFSSFADMIDALQTCGVGGPIVVNVDSASGPYNEQVIFQNLPDLTATNSLTINGNAASIEFDAGSNGPDYRLVGFNNVKHITLNNLRIAELGTSTAFGIHFTNNADSITVKNCIVDMSATTVTSSSIGGIIESGSFTSMFSSNFNASDGLVIDSNQLVGFLYYGIYFNSPTLGQNNIISNNTIEDFYAMGMRFVSQNSLTIDRNEISNPTISSGGTLYGIYFQGGLSDGMISNNWIHHPFGDGSSATNSSFGIYLNNVDGTLATPNELSNNIISHFESNGAQYGIYGTGSDYLNIYHNSISLDYQGGTGNSTHCVYVASNHINIRNNILSATRSIVSSACSPIRISGSLINCDNNVLFNDTNNTNVFNAIGFDGFTPYAELAQWQTANGGIYDGNSVQTNPAFTNPANNDFTPLSNTADDIGTPVGVLTDINGDSRSLTTPDAGAIEFVGVPGDVALIDAHIARVDTCYNSNDTVWIEIQNLVGGQINFGVDTLRAHWSITGPENSSGTIEVNTGTLNEGNFTMLHDASADLSSPGLYTLEVYLDTNAVNVGVGNDTIEDVEEFVDTIMVVLPAYDTITSPYDSVLLLAISPFAPGGDVKISEVSLQRTGTGQPLPGGWFGATYNYITDDDNFELSGVPFASLEGYSIDLYFSFSSSPWQSHTFSENAQFNEDGMLFCGSGGAGGDIDVLNNYYRLGWSSNLLSSFSTIGVVLRDPDGNVVDVAVHGTSFTWSTLSGVASGDWSANMSASPAGTSGIRRTGATDNNNGTDWVVANFSNPQTPNYFNTGMNAIVAPTFPDFTWTYNSGTIATTTTHTVGPWTINGDYDYIGSINNSCGLYADTARIHVNLTTAELVSQTNVDCFGENTGEATVTSTGGDEPFTYEWSNSATTATVTNLTAGTYTVTVKDANLWPDTLEVVITENTLLVASIDSTLDISCSGFDDGYAEVSITGGVTAYNYAWSSGSSSATASSLDSGMVYVTVTDDVGCVAMDSAHIGEPELLEVSVATITNNLCNGDSMGVMVSTVTGGNGGYTYSWSDGSTNDSLLNAPAGNYDLTVTDVNVCIASSNTDTITEPDTLQVADSLNMPLCKDDINGSIYLTVSGGVSGYTYAWSNSAITSNIDPIGAGTYSFTITDANSCEYLDSITLNEPDSLLLSIDNITNAVCEFDSNGSVEVSTSGGTMPYAYAWADGTATEDRVMLEDGNYYLTVTDTNGCMYNDSAMVEFTYLQPMLSIAGDDSICFGTSTVISATAGHSIYAWSTSETSDSITIDSAGSYFVDIVDSNGCINNDSFDLWINDEITTSVDIVDATCKGGDDGSATITAVGGQGGFTYSWNDGQNAATATGLMDETVMICGVLDAIGCPAEDSATIGYINENPVVELGADTVICEREDGFDVITLDAGAGFTTYTWSSGESTSSISTTNPAAYSVVVVDGNGCIGGDTINVTSQECLGIDVTDRAIGMRIYPNPTIDAANIDLIALTHGEYALDVMDIQGRIVHHEDITLGSIKTTTRIQKNQIGAGVYMVRVSNGTDIMLQRLVVN